MLSTLTRLGQASLNIAAVIGFLVLIANRMPSKTEEYNKANIFSHCIFVATYYAAVMFHPDWGPAVWNKESGLKHVHIVVTLLVMTLMLMVYLLKACRRAPRTPHTRARVLAHTTRSLTRPPSPCCADPRPLTPGR